MPFALTRTRSCSYRRSSTKIRPLHPSLSAVAFWGKHQNLCLRSSLQTRSRRPFSFSLAGSPSLRAANPRPPASAEKVGTSSKFPVHCLDREWRGTPTRYVLKPGSSFFISSCPTNEDFNLCTTAWARGAQELRASWCVMACWKPENKRIHMKLTEESWVWNNRSWGAYHDTSHIKWWDMYYLPIKIPIFRFLANSILFYSYRIILPYLILYIWSYLFYSGCMHSTAASAVPTNLCNSIRNTTGFTQKHTQWQRHSSRMWCVSKWIPTRVHTGCHLSFMGKKTRLLKIYSHSQLLSSLREHGRLQSNRMAGVQKDKRKAMWVDRICYYRPQSREHGPASQGVQKARRPWQKPKGGAAPAGWAHGADGAAVLSNPVHVWNKLWSCDMPVTCQ